MSFHTTRNLAAALAFVGLAACSTAEPEPAPTPAQTIAPGMNLTALSRICPKAMLDDKQTYKRIYSPSNSKADENLAYQVSLSEYTRTCSVSPSGDQLLLDVAVAGRLIGGPKAKAGTYKVPVHVELVSGDVALYDQVIVKEVNLPAAGGSTQFLFRADDISVPPTVTENTRVRVGVE